MNKNNIWDYTILTARFLLAFIFLNYGYGKLVGDQFGITEAEMATQLKDISLFKLSWYLFDQEPFKTFVGVSQIICGILLLINRTALLGAFLFLPIIFTILIIDLSFMPPSLAEGFAWRLGFYIFLDFLILWHYKNKLRIIWDAIWLGVNTKYKFPIWAYALLPVFAVLLEVIGWIPKTITQFIISPTETIDGLKKIPDLIGELVKQFSG
jgi:uncharacterized membrane protein YphA (DoxX/SURF4 family)